MKNWRNKKKHVDSKPHKSQVQEMEKRISSFEDNIQQMSTSFKCLDIK